jgi:hypothetical protein
MRQVIGVGTPRGLQGRLVAVVATLLALIRPLWCWTTGHRRRQEHDSLIARPAIPKSVAMHIRVRKMAFTTGC